MAKAALYRKRIELVLLPLLLLLLAVTFSGCQAESNQEDLLLKEEQLSTIESIYNQDRPKVLEALHIEESDISQGTLPGGWDLSEPVSFEGTEFSEILLFDVSAETFYGVRFICYFENAEELSGLAEDILEKANTIYGEPSTYPGLPNRLTSEDFSKELSESMNQGTLGDWREEWSLGEKTRCTLSASVVENNVAFLSLEYSLSQ